MSEGGFSHRELIMASSPRNSQAQREMTNRQYGVYQQMNFLKTHIRCKGANRSSGFEASPNTSTPEESCGSTTDTEHLESSVLRKSSQPTLTSTPVSTDFKILEHFDPMRTLISGFLQQKSDRQPLPDYVASEAEKMTQEEFEDLKGRILETLKRSATITRESQKVRKLPTTTQQESSSTQATAAFPAVTSTTHPAPLALETLHLWSQYRMRAVDTT